VFVLTVRQFSSQQLKSLIAYNKALWQYDGMDDIFMTNLCFYYQIVVGVFSGNLWLS
jgi:hypothetical protein